jgi:hypothetical protein
MLSLAYLQLCLLPNHLHSQLDPYYASCINSEHFSVASTKVPRLIILAHNSFIHGWLNHCAKWLWCLISQLVTWFSVVFRLSSPLDNME